MQRLNPIRVAYMRHIGPYHEVGPTFTRLCQWAGERGLSRSGLRLIGASWDNPAVVPAALLRYDACIEVEEDFHPVDEIPVQTFPGGEYAVYRHVGPYSGLAEAFRRLLYEWLPSSGRHSRGGACLEIYAPQDHAVTPPAELITDLLIPVR
ncbi:MAG TPA: GyrI-like domain-containing protein [candidate division Zixibacteria bacterium]|nr:GyrI-like domain-containing protein [candidate division Zixibacteria bacterium]